MPDEVNDEVNTKLDVIPGIAMKYFSLMSNTVIRGDFGPRGDFGQFWKLHSMIISGFIFEFEMN